MQKNTSKAAFASALLPSQFVESDDLQLLVASFVGDSTHGAQELENVFWDLLTKRSLATATGACENIVGDHVGQHRESSDDEDYREALYVKIGSNTSQGQGERLIYILQHISHPTWIHLFDTPPACCTAFLFMPTSLAVLTRIQKAALGGVRIIVMASMTTDPFVFGYDKDIAGADHGTLLPYGHGYGELTQSIGGNYSELII